MGYKYLLYKGECHIVSYGTLDGVVFNFPEHNKVGLCFSELPIGYHVIEFCNIIGKIVLSIEFYGTSTNIPAVICNEITPMIEALYGTRG